MDDVKNKLKDAIGRQRPFLSHRELKPCLPREYSESYPSGHSTWYVTTSLLLADLLPERKERLLQVGRQGMAARVTCGMHYPSDVEAGQRLAEAAALQIIGSPPVEAVQEVRTTRDQGFDAATLCRSGCRLRLVRKS